MLNANANGNANTTQIGLANSHNSLSMNIDLDGLRSTVDPNKMFVPRAHPLNQSSQPFSAPVTSTVETACCLMCSRHTTAPSHP